MIRIACWSLYCVDTAEMDGKFKLNFLGYWNDLNFSKIETLKLKDSGLGQCKINDLPSQSVMCGILHFKLLNFIW